MDTTSLNNFHKVESQFPSVILKLLCFSVLIHLTEPAVKYSSRIVETKNGRIRGIIVDMERKRLEAVEVFKGIPYASSPIGNSRFETVVEHEPWNDTFLADHFGPVCPQMLPNLSNKTTALLRMTLLQYEHLKRIVTELTHQSEDCLNLNIYVPSKGSILELDSQTSSSYSVIVFVHGESFDYGSGNLYDASTLASYSNVIVVTFNYRLGILGECPIILAYNT